MWSIFITILVVGWFLYSIMKSGSNDEKFRKLRKKWLKLVGKIQFVYITSQVPLKKSTLFLGIWSKLSMRVFVNSTDATL